MLKLPSKLWIIQWLPNGDDKWLFVEIVTSSKARDRKVKYLSPMGKYRAIPYIKGVTK